MVWSKCAAWTATAHHGRRRELLPTRRASVASSLLSELEVDPQYIAAQGAVAADMGLAIEELGEELASQELAFLRNSGHNLSTLDADDADWWTTAAADC